MSFCQFYIIHNLEKKRTNISLEGNPIETHLNWRNRKDFKGERAIRAVKFVEDYFIREKMKSIDFSGCQFTKKGGETIFRILTSFPRLEILNVSNTGIARLFGIGSFYKMLLIRSSFISKTWRNCNAIDFEFC